MTTRKRTDYYDGDRPTKVKCRMKDGKWHVYFTGTADEGYPKITFFHDQEYIGGRSNEIPKTDRISWADLPTWIKQVVRMMYDITHRI